MDYTIEEIYAIVGKEDKTTGLTFKYNSEAFNTFGSFITVFILYTQKDREEMDELIQNEHWVNHGYVKARFLGRDLEKEKITLLREKGIYSQDISEIHYYNAPSKNAFHSKARRKIGKIEIPLQSGSKGESFDWMYSFSKKQVCENIELSPNERAFYLAGKIYYEPNELTSEENQEIYQDDGSLDVKIEWELLQIKYIREDITDEEKKRLAQLYGVKKEESFEILDKYLQEAGSSLKKIAKENLDQAAKLLIAVMDFKERILTVNSKHPIYLDLDSYLHIYMRHVEEFQVSKHFENKDNFQWDEDDVFSVMEHVLKEVENEYEQFREGNSGKRYSRFGDHSMYFEGDYYTFHIEADGRVSTFHKNRKKHEKK